MVSHRRFARCPLPRRLSSTFFVVFRRRSSSFVVVRRRSSKVKEAMGHARLQIIHHISGRERSNKNILYRPAFVEGQIEKPDQVPTFYDFTDPKQGNPQWERPFSKKVGIWSGSTIEATLRRINHVRGRRRPNKNVLYRPTNDEERRRNWVSTLLYCFYAIPKQKTLNGNSDLRRKMQNQSNYPRPMGRSERAIMYENVQSPIRMYIWTWRRRRRKIESG